MSISPYKLIVLFFVFYLASISLADDSTLEIYKNPPVFTIEGKVEKIDATDKIDYQEFVKQQKTPVILKKTIVDTWGARKKWSVSYLNKNLPGLKKVHISDSYRIDFFNGAKEYPMSALPTVPKEWNTTVREMMSTRAFFGKIQDPAEDKYIYYTGSLYTLYKKIWPDVKPVDQFWIRKEGKQVNVWMGEAGVTSQAHYDASYNFFAQLVGRKRFLLFDPKEYKNLYMYPMLHPYARQSQVNLETPDLVTFPNVPKARAIEAILEPGDVLYLPPYWLHHVTALDLSISVNVWSDSEEQVIYNKQITKEPLPLDAEWDTAKRIQLVRHFLYQLVDSVLGENKAHEFLHETVYESRYKTFLSTAFANPSSIDLSSCKKNVQTGSVAENTETTTDDTSKTVLTGVDSSTINGEQVEEFEEKVESSEEEPKAIEVSEQIKEENKEEQTEETKEENKEEASTSGEYKEEKEEINKFLKEKILPAFAKMKTYGREGVTDLLLAYYIEGIVELMFGVANVPYYFDQCL
jgi:ribosomal protein L16 Arg81 hydroxylase